jgi:aspartyl protease family protein
VAAADRRRRGDYLALWRAFPGALNATDNKFSLVYLLGFLLLLSTGLFRAGRAQLGQHLRHAAIWAAIVAVLAVGLAYRAEIAGIGQRVRIAFSGGDPVATGAHELVVPRGQDGAFALIGQVNGQRVRFLVDTGASETVLSPADARRLGVDTGALTYGYAAETANGTGYGAPYVARSLEVGPIRIAQMPMVINQAPMSSSLLGLSFLDRLESFHVSGDRLTLTWR